MTKKATAVAEVKTENVLAFVDGMLRIPELPDAEAYFDEGIRSFSRSGMEMARAGRCWQIAKKGIGHGSFTEAIRKAGLDPRHVQNAMQLSEFLGRLPEPEAKKLAAQPYTKVLALAQADPEVVEDIIESGDADEFVGLSVRQLKERLKAAEQKAAREHAARERAENLRDQVGRMASALEAEDGIPPFARAPRQEIFAFDAAASFQLDALEILLNELVLSEVKHPEAYRFQPIVAANYQAVFAKIVGRITAMAKRIEQQHPDAGDAPVTLDHQLTPKESALLADRVERMLFGLKQQAAARAEDRENSTPGKRGRPLGSGKKK